MSAVTVKRAPTTLRGWRLRAYPTDEQEAKLLAWSAAGGRFWNELVAWWRTGLRINERSTTVLLASGVTITPDVSLDTWMRLAGGPKGPARPFRHEGAGAVTVINSNRDLLLPEWAVDVPAKILHGVGQDFDQAVALWHSRQRDAAAIRAWREKRKRRGKPQLPKRVFGAPTFCRSGERLNLRWQEQGDPLVHISKRRSALKVVGFAAAGLGPLLVHRDNGLPSDAVIKSVRLTRDSEGKWWAGLSVEVPAPIRRAAPKANVGLDRGVTIPVACSDGPHLTEIPGLKPGEAARLRWLERQLARIHRQVSPACHAPGARCTGSCAFHRTVRDDQGRIVSGPSKNVVALRRQVAKLKAREARRRQHARHTFTRRIVDTYSTIVVEDLNVRAMTSSARGSVDQPGNQVAQKRGLNRSISRIGWSEVERQLLYKATEAGRTLIKVPAPYTSQTCSECGHVDPNNRRTQERFCCTACGVILNADENAARVIEQFGVLTGTTDAPKRLGEEAAEPTTGSDTLPMGEEPASGTRKGRAPRENTGMVGGHADHVNVDISERSDAHPNPGKRSHASDQRKPSAPSDHQPREAYIERDHSQQPTNDQADAHVRGEPSRKST